MALNIIKTGLMDSLQDSGRYGHAEAGINPGGVMDPYAASVANFLVGNTREEAVMELHFPACQVLFNQPALVAVCGADFSASVHDEPMPCWQPVMVKRNSILHFQKWKWGARAYLAVQGGFCADRWLDSYSTHLKAGAGGYNGRLIKKDDVMKLRNDIVNICPAKQYIATDRYSRTLNWGVHEHAVYKNASELLVLPGPEWDILNEDSQKIFTGSPFTISKKSDRMGCLLNGASLQSDETNELISTGVDYGTIQLLPNGQLMVLAADHQTTGGYPRIANVIGAHLPKLAQLPIEAEVHFTLTDIRTAEQLLFSQMRELKIIERSCLDRITQLYARY
ncbi:MAG: biotin-dependent carboxyltransferase family protein [Chitinophagaceae bacterium]